MISPLAVKIISKLPKSMVCFLAKRIINRCMNKYADIEVTGMENLKDIKKPIIFICNHLSNSDALVLMEVFKEQDLTFVAGAKLSDNPLTNLGISIAKTITIKPNTADKDALSSIIKMLRAGNNILIFPEGTRSRTASLIEAKKGIVLIQRLSKAIVVPVGMWGTEKLLPINDQDMGSEKFHHAKVRINIGKPVDIPVKDKEEDKHDYEERILTYFMKSIAALLPENYRGIYK
ncbi:lysophospholipid acyltransferase family protein [Clostridium peptidivorans]|uniref:lysophospholipid acyltransferase family protein n=1 Tax=Clostridium peptidivorans TaxID=100174 RepID=UPI000BE42F90|nr:lysophospholipid acyltransferase family protein [Clostridium peptidivorans]